MSRENLAAFAERAELAVFDATQRMGDDSPVRVEEVTIEVEYTLEKTTDGSFSIKIIEFGADISGSETHKISLTLKPREVTSLAALGDDLVGAVWEIEQAIANVTKMNLIHAIVEISIGWSSEGSGKIVGVGASIDSAITHLLKIKLGPR